MTNGISTLDEARDFAQQWLDQDLGTEVTARLIMLCASRYQDNDPSLYARYLVSVAFRELLPTEEPYPGTDFTPPLHEPLIFEDVFEEWPSEQQVIDWNIHNDHADGADWDDV